MGYRLESDPFLDYYGGALEGLEPFSRILGGDAASVTMSSQIVRFVFVTARKPATVSKLVAVSGTTPAAATPSVVRFGLYTADSSNNLTLIARSANSTSTFAIASTEYVLSMDTTGGYPASVTLAAGQRYALACLVVTAAAAPTIYARNGILSTTTARAPRLTAFKGGESDLATSYAVGALSNTAGAIWMGAVA